MDSKFISGWKVSAWCWRVNNYELVTRKVDILKPVREMNKTKSRGFSVDEERAERRNKFRIWGFSRQTKPQKSAGNMRLRRYLHELNRVLISFSMVNLNGGNWVGLKGWKDPSNLPHLFAFNATKSGKICTKRFFSFARRKGNCESRLI